MKRYYLEKNGQACKADKKDVPSINSWKNDKENKGGTIQFISSIINTLVSIKEIFP